MEALIIAGLAVVGYSLVSKGKSPRDQKKVRENISINEDPYANKKLKDVIKVEQELANERFAKAKDPYNNNVIIGTFLSPEVIVEQNQTILPLKETQDKFLKKYKSNERGNIIDDNKVKSSNEIETFTLSPSLTGPTGLTGISGKEQNFTHNNMVPFFGGNLKGNNIPENSLIVEQHTGVQNRWRKPKREVENFASINRQQVNGNIPFQDIISRDRFIESNKKQGVLPFPQERTHYIEPEYVRSQFRNVDDLRVKQKAAVEYKGRIIDGQRQIFRTRDIENFERHKNDITSNKNILIPTAAMMKESGRIYRNGDKHGVDSHDSREICKESYEADNMHNLQQSTRGNTLPLNEDTRPTIKQTTHSKYIGGVGSKDINKATSRGGKYIMKEKNVESTQFDGITRSQYNSVLKDQTSRQQYINRYEKTDKECLLESRTPGGGLGLGTESSTVHLSNFGNREEQTQYISQGNAPVQPQYGLNGIESRENYNTNIDDQSAQRIADASLVVSQLDENPFNIR